MSVVTGQARRRWALVAVALVVLAWLPTTASALAEAVAKARAGSGTAGIAEPPEQTVRRALASGQVPHSGLARSRGNLGLPDLPRLGDVASTLGGVTLTRVWWVDPQAWRVDVLAGTGEQDSYGAAGSTVQWDYESYRLTDLTGSPALRLPRADDLLPPQVARRLLGGVGPGDRLEALPGRRVVAGVVTHGVRIRPSDARSSIGYLEVWVEPAHDLPLAVSVVDTRGATAMESRFTQLDLSRPGADLVTPPTAPGALHDSSTEPDLLARVEHIGAWQLPDRLAGLTSSEPIVGGTATYGSGLIRLVVLPIPLRLAWQTLTAVRAGGGTPLDLPGGEALLVTSGVLDLVVALGEDGRHGYLIAGLVTPQLVTEAARQLLADPPPERNA